jgi:23S rRNA (uracil1939-C5)-methyltransferase
MPNIVPPAPSITPICPYFYQCGGCESQDIPYAQQLSTKETWLRTLFHGVVPEEMWQPIIGSPDEYPTYFRNKIRFSFVREEGKVFASRHQKGSDEADIPVDQCFLLSPIADKIMNLTAAIATEYEWSLYDPKTRSGWLKHLLIRQGKKTGEFLVSLVTDEGSNEGVGNWSERIKAEIPEVVSIYLLQSWGASNTRFEDSLLWGKKGITETVGTYTFWISPHSFFQTNGSMVETMYTTISEHAGLTGSEHLWDLYAGSATIGMFLSEKAGKVTSIESNPANVADAKWNIEHNTIHNISVHEGLVEQLVTSAFICEVGPPDVVIVDPPRAGLHERFRNLLPNLAAGKIVYVSCNPISCLRDVREIAASGYRITAAQGIDMFPHSWHCELILTLERITK